MTDDVFTCHSQHLQEAFSITLDRYRSFLQTDHRDDPKSVTAHHQAGKAAVTHMTALVKLLKIFDKSDLKKDKEADMEALLRQARSVLADKVYEQENQL